MLGGIHFETLRFAAPAFLWLLFAPLVLGVLLLWRVVRRRAQLRRYARRPMAPGVKGIAWLGDLAPWLPMLLASVFGICALARPEALVEVVQNSGVDIVILQDASASMYVDDVPPNRWRRSQQFVRALASAMHWEGDRVALALFAHRTAPQLRLTRDPNSLLFFLDHLGDVSPFPLEDDTTWDTNIAEAVHWGLRLLEKNEELFGRSSNVRAFLLISDGQAWSGELASALERARESDVPIHVIGVGTVAGGMIPEPRGDDGIVPPGKIRAVLDRASLRDIARATGGRYFDLGAAADQDTAFELLGELRRHARTSQSEERIEPLYWQFLLACVLSAGIGALLANRSVERRWQLATAVGGAAMLALLL